MVRKPGIRSAGGELTSRYARELGARMRAVRVQQGLSLHQVEQRSAGRFRGVALASYERGERAVTAVRLAGLAQVYRVPLAALLPDDGRRRPETDADTPRLVLDLTAVGQLSPVGDLAAVARFADTVRAWRGDWAGQVLSVRISDRATLALMCGLDPAVLVDRLAAAGVALTGDRLAHTLSWKHGSTSRELTTGARP